MRKLKQIWRWLLAAALSIVWVAFTQLLELNIDTLGSQKHLDLLGSTIILTLAVFSHTWWGAFVLGIAALATILAFINAAKDWFDERDKRLNPIKIEFDETNPDRHFWSSKYVGQGDEHYSEYVTEYRLRITNRTSRTIRGLQVKCTYSRGYSRSLEFVTESKTSCDLHPGGSDFVTIFQYDELWELNRENDEDYENPRRLRVQASGTDINTCECIMEIDVAKDPVLAIIR